MTYVRASPNQGDRFTKMVGSALTRHAYSHLPGLHNRRYWFVTMTVAQLSYADRRRVAPALEMAADNGTS